MWQELLVYSIQEEVKMYVSQLHFMIFKHPENVFIKKHSVLIDDISPQKGRI